jgi:3-phytase
MELLNRFKNGWSSQVCIFLCFFSLACAQNHVRDLEKAKILSWQSAPALAKGSSLKLGGQSGLLLLGQTPEGNLRLLTHTDRGPNGEVENGLRPFHIPSYAPELIELELSLKENTVQVVKRVVLRSHNGTPLTGLPNIASDEVPVDANHKKIAHDLGGLDLEGIARDDQGNLWMVEEYRPSLIKFSAEGVLMRRFVPEGSFSQQEVQLIEKKWGKGSLAQVLPKKLKTRRANRGFEGVTFANGRLHLILQSPFKKGEGKVPWIEFDPKKEIVVSDSLYELRNPKVEKIGDISFDGRNFYLIEQNGRVDEKAVQDIVRVRKVEGVWRAEKSWSLIAAGVRGLEKMEGLARLPDGRFALVNDNDFEVNGSAANHVILFSLKD